MRGLIFALLLILAAPLTAGTVYVARIKGGGPTLMLMKIGWSQTLVGDSTANISCAPLVRDSLGVVDTLEYRLRLIGVDLRQVELVPVDSAWAVDSLLAR